MKPLLVYLLLINALSLLLMLTDKRRAKKKQWRIPESTLIGFAVIGGSAGCILAMHLFRHKTRHPKFSIGVPVILALQIMIAVICVILF